MENLKLSTIYIVFYKGKGSLSENLIRFWTHSPYAHSEFVRTDRLMHSNDRRTLISRLKPFYQNENDWDIIELYLPNEIIQRVQKRQLRKNGTSYDWLGICFSQVLKLGLHNKNKWFCSKSNADDLIYAYKLMKRLKQYKHFAPVLQPICELSANDYSPALLYKTVSKIRRLNMDYMRIR